jgi:hypothetical protein
VRKSAENAAEFWGRKGIGEDKLAHEQKGVSFTPADLSLGIPLEGSLELHAYIRRSMSGQGTSAVVGLYPQLANRLAALTGSREKF